MSKKINSLYVHIPFCDHICSYCDFTKLFYNQKFTEPYLKALFAEIDSYKIGEVETIYIGGGTPTSLNLDELEKLLGKVSPLLAEGGEFSVEANVENITKDKLLLLKRFGVNRLSIGVQSTNDTTLKLIGRNHTFKDAKEAILLARQVGFDNINVDLMFGFPESFGQSLEIDIRNILSLNTEHISIYSLILSEGTRFYNENIRCQNDDELRECYDKIVNELRSAGYERYEVSNFAKNKKYSKHNLTYWHDDEYYGVGLGASGYVNGVRYTNTKNLNNYIDGRYIDFSEKLTEKEQVEDFLLCNFRLESGFSNEEFKKRFSKSFCEYFKNTLPLIKDGLISFDGDFIHLTDDGIAIMDSIIVKLIH